MARFTDVETQLLRHISEDRLRSSLAAIRQAMEDIWANDTPRIVQDFTDHGEKHSERLTRFAAKLLEANYGLPFSDQEIYLLMAGIYLHDIGMQCDVIKHPEIKARAEDLGAQFTVAFTAQTTSRYNLVEQKAIRRNHHYLTAAWIDHADRTGETVLGPAVRTIPEDLVDDVIDACKYHAKQPITDCPPQFMFDSTGRKQLVAALLRLADELDIDAHRVSIETVKNFALDPYNSVYWWLHHHTKIVFSARNMILLTIRLHPNDAEQLGPLVEAIFINGFEKKNKPVISVLTRNNIPIVVDSNSRVMRHDRAKPLPPEIVETVLGLQEELDQNLDAREKSSNVKDKKKSILIVEDDEIWQDILNRLLEKRGCKVELETGYRQALDRILRVGARSSASDLALCVVDLSLRGSIDQEENRDGLGLLALCKVLEIPAIVVSGYLSHPLKDQLHDKYGAMASFNKLPLPADEFLATVNNALTSAVSHH
jgi:CheY-like chemotaxis protein